MACSPSIPFLTMAFWSLKGLSVHLKLKPTAQSPNPPLLHHHLLPTVQSPDPPPIGFPHPHPHLHLLQRPFQNQYLHIYQHHHRQSDIMRVKRTIPSNGRKNLIHGSNRVPSMMLMHTVSEPTRNGLIRLTRCGSRRRGTV
jgi:hypothetical protein